MWIKLKRLQHTKKKTTYWNDNEQMMTRHRWKERKKITNMLHLIDYRVIRKVQMQQKKRKRAVNPIACTQYNRLVLWKTVKCKITVQKQRQKRVMAAAKLQNIKMDRLARPTFSKHLSRPDEKKKINKKEAFINFQQ